MRSERIDVLDVLRGIALLGMFLVHFNNGAVPAGSGAGAVYQSAVPLLFEERFWAMFGILFGVGFAVQLRRAEERGGSFTPIYIRRMIALAAFGFFAHAVLGFNVLLGYAVWGVPLLLLRRRPMAVLLVAVVISAASWSSFSIARASYCSATAGDAACRAQLAARAQANGAFNRANREAQDAPDFRSVLTARFAHMRWFYAQPFSFLPVNTFTLFLLGVIGLRAGLFDDPAKHRKTIVAMMVFGAASWAASEWILGPPADDDGSSLVRQVVAGTLAGGFGLIRHMWLTFTYMGIVLLLVAHDRRWLSRLGAFAWTGRMALTNYMIQIAILDVLFSNYAFHARLGPLQALGAGLVLFGADAVLCRWWLARFRFGPLEWLWRSITYGRPQPWRTATPATAAVAPV